MTRRLRRTVAGTCLVFVVDNLLGKLRLARGDIESYSGALHASLDTAGSLAYVRQVHLEYLDEIGLPAFHGRVAEVGPGDSCGVALLIRGDGAEQVDLVDRFYSRRDEARHGAVYRSLIAATPGLASFAGLDREEQFAGLTRRYGDSASAEAFFTGGEAYDFIVSRAVMEHVTDPVLALRRMAAALKPGGVMTHVVDLGDHTMFTGSGFHELKFLELPDWLYREMTAAVGRPNRVPLAAYREALPGSDLKVTRLVGAERLSKPVPFDQIPRAQRDRSVALVRAHKARLHRRYRALADEDLAVAGFVLTHWSA